MKDVVYLAIGELRVPFGEYEGDTLAYCRGIQDAFRYLGIDSDVSEAILDRLEQKPQRVQKAFLLRIAGKTEGEIAYLTGVCQQTISKDIRHRCADVRQVLIDAVKPIERN